MSKGCLPWGRGGVKREARNRWARKNEAWRSDSIRAMTSMSRAKQVIAAASAIALMIGARSASADPATSAAGKIVNQQFAEWKATLANPVAGKSAVFAPGSKLGVTGALGLQNEVVPAALASELFGNVILDGADVQDVRVATSADGSSEWIYFTATVKRTNEGGPMEPAKVRGSELVSKHGDKWMVDGGELSVGHADAEVVAAIKGKTLGVLQPVTDAATGDKDVLATAFTEPDRQRLRRRVDGAQGLHHRRQWAGRG